MNIGKRIQVEGIDLHSALKPWSRPLSWWKFAGGHGGDEYGNCSVYFRCFLFGIVFFWDPHYQDKVELPLNTTPSIFHEVQAWRRWYCAKFEGGENLWD